MVVDRESDEMLRKDIQLVLSFGKDRKIGAIKAIYRKYTDLGLNRARQYTEYLLDNADTPVHLLDGHRAFLPRRR